MPQVQAAFNPFENRISNPMRKLADQIFTNEHTKQDQDSNVLASSNAWQIRKKLVLISFFIPSTNLGLEQSLFSYLLALNALRIVVICALQEQTDQHMLQVQD